MEMNLLMLNIAIIPVSMFLLYQGIQIRRIARDDRHLYRFCQLRREVIDLIYSDYQDLSRTEYLAARRLLRVLNITIRNYRDHKTVIFDFRRLIKYYEQHKDIEREAKYINTNNEKILVLVDRTEGALVRAFIAYTPFLKHEFAMKAMFGYLRAFGGKQVEEVIKGLNVLVSQQGVHSYQ